MEYAAQSFLVNVAVEPIAANHANQRVFFQYSNHCRNIFSRICIVCIGEDYVIHVWVDMFKSFG